ncbi:MAG: hypothetical protein JXR95_08925 [Deltaproteobacteria bacterium]|nr:hypothetical protein [Deltaproteobacteria bacterium]
MDTKCGCTHTWYERCYNDADDDFDGAVDCDDADCRLSDFCDLPVELEICDNGSDDDGDGYTDCDDIYCSTFYPCMQVKMDPEGLNDDLAGCSMSNQSTFLSSGTAMIMVLFYVFYFLGKTFLSRNRQDHP